MNIRLQTALKVMTAAIVALGFAVACSNVFGDGDSGILVLSITDAPVDADNVSGVYITFEEVQYHRNGNWETSNDFDGPRTIDVLALSGGERELLGELSLPAGDYTQIRFMLGIGDKEDGNEGSYVEFDDGSTKPLFVPSGQQTGYKAQGNFTVPSNGSISVTADFDLRRAVIRTGGGDYLLRPVIRLVVDDQAGTIAGTVSGGEDGKTYTVMAYETGKYDDSETDGFENAVTSSPVNEDGEYTIAYLPEGTYDLVVAEYTTNEDDGSLSFETASIEAEGVEVGSGETVEEHLDLDN